jgi:excisionase family DNA binding protein
MDNLQKIEQRLSSIEELLLSHKTVLNFTEAAAYCGLSKSYLYKLTSAAGIPCYKPQGKQIYFSRNELDNWLLSNRKETAQEIAQQASTFVTLNRGRAAK